MQMSKQEKLSSFIEMTGVDEGEAFTSLEATDWDLSASYNLYLAQMVKDPNEHKSEDVRAPIAARTSVLNPERNFHSRISVASNPISSFLHNSFLDKENKKKSYPQDLPYLSEKDKNDKVLADIFKPPIELIYQYDFERAKEEGANRSLWILVNLQDMTEFASNTLNRDTWKNEKVRKLIDEHFLFWQRLHDSEDGEIYCRYYQKFAVAFPHISIIDPRTGELMKSWTGHQSPNVFYEELCDFLEQNELNGIIKKKREKINPKVEKKKKSMIDMSEEEQMEYALMASMGQSNPVDLSKEDEEGDEEDVKIVEQPSALKRKQTDLNNEESNAKRAKESINPSSNSIIELDSEENLEKKNGKIEVKKDTEKEATKEEFNGGECHVQFRELNGNTFKHSFSPSDPLEKLYRYVQLHRTDESKSPFQFLSAFPKKSFSEEEMKKSILDLNLGNRFVLIMADAIK
eukprot:TRINITY_DN8455_c0_g1_i1.p1 TRINITY_DN8455_c0_g1~~TRINITY_DN8455_c0_g1_i1.p1  ORF type:complete len:460 (-),score=165.20 TRINITY_DN8455_c0_g1_i1:33-1412(-)